MGSKTLLQQNPPVLNWGCWLVVMVMVLVVVVVAVVAIVVTKTDMRQETKRHYNTK